MQINTKKIKQEMKRQGLGYGELARRCRPPYKSRQAIAYIVNHGKNLHLINRIAKALGVPPRDLIL
jgi:hypothetical protein